MEHIRNTNPGLKSTHLVFEWHLLYKDEVLIRKPGILLIILRVNL